MHTRAGQDDESLAFDGDRALCCPRLRVTRSNANQPPPPVRPPPSAPDPKYGALLPKLGVQLLLFHVFRPLFQELKLNATDEPRSPLGRHVMQWASDLVAYAYQEGQYCNPDHARPCNV